MALNMFSNFLNMFSRKKAPAASQQIAQPSTNLQQAPTAPTPGTLTPAAPAPYTPKAPSVGPLPAFNYQGAPTAPVAPGPVETNPYKLAQTQFNQFLKTDKDYQSTRSGATFTNDALQRYTNRLKSLPYEQAVYALSSIADALPTNMDPVHGVREGNEASFQALLDVVKRGPGPGSSKSPISSYTDLVNTNIQDEGLRKQWLPKILDSLLPYEDAKQILQDPGKYADAFHLDADTLSQVADQVVQRGPLPESNLGLPEEFALPQLTGVPTTGNTTTPAAPGAIPGLPETPDHLSAPTFDPLTLPDININTGFTPELEKQIQDVLMARIEEQKQKDISSAQGAAAMRGLTGGSFEGRMTGAATKGAQKASAEALTQLAIEKATREREAAMEKQKQQFEVYKMELGNKNQAMENYRNRTFTAGEAELDRIYNTQSQQLQNAFTSLESYKQRAFAAGETDKARYYQNQQNEIQRKHEELMQQRQMEYERQQAERARRDAKNKMWIDVASSLLNTAGQTYGEIKG